MSRRGIHSYRNDGRSDERGFVLITFALLLIPIVAFTALAIDVSSWYSRATELQRAADASSLAGVVWMPDLGKAKSHATPVLAKNGIDSTDTARYTVTMNTGGTSAGSFQVCITDKKAPQFFGAVIANQASIERCATSEYNQPLELGSPLNYFGGNHDQTNVFVPGPVPDNAIEPAPPYSAFNPGDRFCWVRDSYPSGTVVGYWDTRGSSNTAYWFYWPYPDNYLSGSHPNCNTSAPAVPNQPNGNGCNPKGNSNYYWYHNGGGGTFPTNWRYRQRSYNTGETCTYGGTQDSPIPVEKSPNFWAAVEAYGNNHTNGDVYSTNGGEYRDTGYYYSIDIPPGGVNGNSLSIQIWDGSTNCNFNGDGCRTVMGDSGSDHTRFRVWKAGDQKFDMSAITPASCGTGSADSGYITSGSAWDDRWNQICTLSVTAGDRYYVQVQSSDSSASSRYGSGYNGYALRAVAGSFPAACLDTMPAGNVACYGTGTQPRVSGYGDMEMYNHIGEGTPTEFYLADVTPNFKGHTLVIDLWDPGDGAPYSWVTVMAPSTSSTSGYPVAFFAVQRV